MSTTTVKVSHEIRDRIAARAAGRNVSQAQIVADAMDSLDRHDFWSAVASGYERLRDNKQEWQEYVAERDEWVGSRLTNESL